jgi:maleylpyruvate isomerase
MSMAATSLIEQLETVRSLVTQATQRLLGDTITVSDEQWRSPSRLPDWTRGHVATHLARNADAMRRLAEWARTGERQDMYASADHRESEILEGAARSALDLQIDLDTSAGKLADAFEELDAANAWDAVVELRGGTRVPARLLPLSRLLEVVIHHVDLDIGYDIGTIDNQEAECLLEWYAFRQRDRDEFPKLVLISDSGFTTNVGSSGEPRTVRASSANLLGWLMNRVDSSAVDGSGDLRLPPF